MKNNHLLPSVHDLVASPDSIIDILTAQCSDLEGLLALAREETRAVENLDFTGLLRIVDERTTLGERLEIYHRQISELRQRLVIEDDTAFVTRATAKTTSIIAEIQQQDAQTGPLLLGAGKQLNDALAEVMRKQHRTNAYAREGYAIPVACDRHA